jgi:FimV-like protein
MIQVTGFSKVGYLLLFTLMCGAIPENTAGFQSQNEIDQLLSEAREYFGQGNETRATQLYERVLDIEPENGEALWNHSVLLTQRGFRLKDQTDPMPFYETAMESADKCLEHHPQKARCHFAKALVTGRIAKRSSARERLSMSKEIKQYIDKALELDPEFAKTWHLLGVWHTEAANLSGVERLAANALFGGAPEGASNEKAIRSFNKALELEPENILIHLDFARLYIEMGEEEKAIELLEKLLTLEPVYEDDERNKKIARDLLNELK